LSGVDLDGLQERVERLVRMAVEAATSLSELVDCAHAAAALDDPALLEAVAQRLASEVDEALASSSAWQAELDYSKIDAWAQTGHKARLLAEAYGLVVPRLRDRRRATRTSAAAHVTAR
jgi:hypothetical protein